MTKLFEGFIFDIDGTLTSTNQLIYASFNHIAEKYLNRTFTEDEIHSMFGPTEEYILKELCGDNFKEAQETYYKFYIENHNKMASAYDGMIEILNHLKSKDYPLGIFTGKGRRAALITLEKVDAIKYFDLIVTGDDVVNHKPNAEGILKFVNEFGLKNENVLMIGDSVGDVKASKEAGVKIASVLWDSYGKEKVQKLESDYYFHSVEELRKYFIEG